LGGLRNKAARKHLLSKANLTLEKALEIAQGMETANSNTQEMKVGESAAVHSVQGASGSSHRPSEECYRCGRKNHSPHECHFKDVACRKCEQEHIAKVCHAKNSTRRKPKKWKTHRNGRRNAPREGGPRIRGRELGRYVGWLIGLQGPWVHVAVHVHQDAD